MKALRLSSNSSDQRNPPEAADSLFCWDSIFSFKRQLFSFLWIWFTLIITGPCLCDLAAAQSTNRVEQWSVFELSLKGPSSGNPFVDVQLTATFTQADHSMEVTGFYDGDGIYRVRFMPDKQGEWNYVTKSSSGELNGKTGVLTVTKPSPENHGAVHVANIYHFAYADGTPYWELGTTCYAWVHQDESLEGQTLKTLAASPFNKLRMCIFPKRYDWNKNEPLLYPFEGVPPANWDFTRFNPKFFQHLEQRILDLQKLGIEADVILFHPYDKGHWGFDRMPADADDRYLRYVNARLGAYRNVWWSLANEWDLMKEKRELDFVRFGEILSHDDPYHRLISIHNSRKLFNNTLPWITHASIQDGSAAEDPGRAMLFRDVYRKPIVFDEVKYEGNIPRRWGNLSAQEMVYRFWNGTVAGTYVGHGETYLSSDDVLWWSKGGVLKGQSPARLMFLRNVLDHAPAEGIDPVDNMNQDHCVGGKAGEYYLIYFGKEQPRSWVFNLPRNNLKDDLKFHIDVLDTWNMTVSPVDGVFTTKKDDDYTFGEANGRAVTLPGKPWIALRIQKAD
jgi:hypothetical protein